MLTIKDITSKINPIKVNITRNGEIKFTVKTLPDINFTKWLIMNGFYYKTEPNFKDFTFILTLIPNHIFN